MTQHSGQTEPAFRELVRVLEGAVQAGADSLGMEYEDRTWIVYYNFGNTGLGAARIAPELQQAVIEQMVQRAGLTRKSKGKIQVTLLGREFEVGVEEYDSFGESAFNLTIKEKRTKAAVRKPPASSKSTWKNAALSTDPGTVSIYTLVVFLPRRPPIKTFAKQKSGVSRTIQIRGDQTLEDLHHTIFNAFDREEEHLYEFQLGRGPRDRQGPIYGLQDTGGDYVGGLVSETTIDSLGLRVGRSFGYLFDFGDSWQHQIDVEAIEEAVPNGNYPRVIKRVGKSPPQYPDGDE